MFRELWHFPVRAVIQRIQFSIAIPRTMVVPFLYTSRSERDVHPYIHFAYDVPGCLMMGACVRLCFLPRGFPGGSSSGVRILACNVVEDAGIATCSTVLPLERLHDVLGVALLHHLLGLRTMERFYDNSFRDECKDQCRMFCLCLMAVEHCPLDIVYSTVAQPQQVELFDFMCGRFCTIDYPLKMETGFLGGDLEPYSPRRELLLIDEYPEISPYRVQFALSNLLALGAAGVALVWGDPLSFSPEPRIVLWRDGGR